MGLKSSNHQVLQNWASLTPDRWRSRNSPFEESRIHLPSISIPKRSQNSELLGTKHVFCWFTIGFIVVLPPGCTSTPFNGSFSVLWHETATLSAQHAVKACFVPWGFEKIIGVQHVMWWWMRSRGPSRFKWEPWVWPLRIEYFLKKWFRFHLIFFEKPGFKQHGTQFQRLLRILCFMLCWNPFANYRETLKHRVRYLYLPRVYTNRSTRKKHREHYGEHYILRMVCFFGVLWSQVKLNLIFCFNPLWHFFTFLCAFVKWWASWATTNCHVFLASLQTTIWEHIFFTFSKHLEQIQGFILSNRKGSSLPSTTKVATPTCL